MKLLYLILVLMIPSLTFSQMGNENWSKDFERLKGKEFEYDGNSGFTFLKKQIYSETQSEEWWTSEKKSWYKSFIATDKRSKKFNIELNEELSSQFKYPYQLLDKYELKNNKTVFVEDVLSKERYVVESIIGYMPGGETTKSTYYIFDMQERKRYNISGTSNVSKLIEKIVKMIELE